MPWNKGGALPCFQLGWSFPVAARSGRAVGHRGRGSSPPREKGVLARLPQLSEPGTRREPPTPLCAPAAAAAAGGGEHRSELQAPQGGREAGTVGRAVPLRPRRVRSARVSPSCPVQPVSRGLRVTARGIALQSLSCSRDGGGDPGHRPGESGGGRTRPGGGSGRWMVPLRPDPGDRQRCGLFLGVVFGHSQRACMCQELLSEWKWCLYTDGTASAVAGVALVSASASSMAQYLVLAFPYLAAVHFRVLKDLFIFSFAH